MVCKPFAFFAKNFVLFAVKFFLPQRSLSRKRKEYKVLILKYAKSYNSR